MRISDWSSDVCSSDLAFISGQRQRILPRRCSLVWSSGMADMRMNRHVPIYSQSRPILREIDSGGYGFAVMQPLFLANGRSEEHTSELQSLMRIAYAVFCLQKKKHHHSIPFLLQ